MGKGRLLEELMGVVVLFLVYGGSFLVFGFVYEGVGLFLVGLFFVLDDFGVWLDWDCIFYCFWIFLCFEVNGRV